MTTLVAGATGTIGSRVVRELCAQEGEVRAFVRDADAARRILGPDVELAPGDFAEPASLATALKGVDRLFLASRNVPGQVALERNVLDAAASGGVELVVKLSAMGAEAGSSVPFWDNQGRIEAHLRASGLPAVVLRPAFFMSSLLAWADGVRHTGRLFVPAGDARMTMIDPADVAAVAVAALTGEGHGGVTYRLTGPEALTFHDVAAELSRVTGRTVEYVDVPAAAANEAMTQSGLDEWTAGGLVALFEAFKHGAGEERSDDVQRVLGRPPRRLAEFAAEQVTAFAPPAARGVRG